MTNWFVCDGKLAEVVSNHVGLDLDNVEDLAVVDSNDGSNHFGQNDHVAQVGLDDGGLFSGRSSLLGSTQLVDESLRLGLQSTRRQTTTLTSQQLVHQVLLAQTQQSVQINAAIRKLLENAILSLSSLLSKKTKKLKFFF